MFDHLNFLFAKLLFGKKARIRVYRQLERMMRNNIQIPVALDTVYDRASRKGTKPTAPEAIIIDRWRRSVHTSGVLGPGLDGTIPLNEQMLIEAGEVSGDLPKALADVVEIAQSQGKIRNALIGGLAYPAFLVLALIGMCWMFSIYVIPPFEMALPMDRWTGTAASLAYFSELTRSGTLPLLVFLVLAVIGYGYSASRWTGALRTRFDRFPPWSMYRLFVGSGFMLSLSALIKADIATPKALEKLDETASPYLSERIRAILRNVSSGLDVGSAMHETGQNFPDPEIVADLKVYGPLPNFEHALDQTAKEWIEESATRISAQAKAMNSIVLILLALVIGWIAGGLFDLMNQIGSAAMFA